MGDHRENKAQLPAAPETVAAANLSRDDLLTLLMRHDALTRAYFRNDRRLFPGRVLDVSLATALLAATATQLDEAGHKSAPLILPAKRQSRS